MKSPKQVWEEAYPDRRKREALDQEPAPLNHLELIAPQYLYRNSLERKIALKKAQSSQKQP